MCEIVSRETLDEEGEGGGDGGKSAVFGEGSLGAAFGGDGVEGCLGLAGDNDDGGRGGGGEFAQCGDGVVTGDVGEVEVGDDEVDVGCFEYFLGVGKGSGGVCLVAVALADHGEHLDDEFAVVEQKNIVRHDLSLRDRVRR